MAKNTAGMMASTGERASISRAMDMALGRVNECLETAIRLTGSGLEDVGKRPDGGALQNLDSKLEWLNGQLLDLSRMLEQIEEWIGV